MRRVEPKVYLVGEMKLVRGEEGLDGYLERIGTDWRPEPSIADNEALVEVMGRLCYRSWEPGMNANVTKVREGNQPYLKNILTVGHGSVVEHATMSFILADVSRVFTHEIVRHRVGMAISQESLRFVRLTDLGLWLPPWAENDAFLKGLFAMEFVHAEEVQVQLAQYFKLDDPGVDFKRKKEITSFMRRLAPHGLATSIGLTLNARSLRHILEMRAAAAAEEELRLVIPQLGKFAKERWPNLFQDCRFDKDGLWESEHRKI